MIVAHPFRLYCICIIEKYISALLLAKRNKVIQNTYKNVSKKFNNNRRILKETFFNIFLKKILLRLNSDFNLKETFKIFFWKGSIPFSFLPSLLSNALRIFPLLSSLNLKILSPTYLSLFISLFFSFSLSLSFSLSFIQHTCTLLSLSYFLSLVDKKKFLCFVRLM